MVGVVTGVFSRCDSAGSILTQVTRRVFKHDWRNPEFHVAEPVVLNQPDYRHTSMRLGEVFY